MGRIREDLDELDERVEELEQRVNGPCDGGKPFAKCHGQDADAVMAVVREQVGSKLDVFARSMEAMVRAHLHTIEDAIADDELADKIAMGVERRFDGPLRQIAKLPQSLDAIVDLIHALEAMTKEARRVLSDRASISDNIRRWRPNPAMGDVDASAWTSRMNQLADAVKNGSV